MHRNVCIATAFGLIALAACSPPKPPEEERRPEPQAQAETQPQSALVQTADAYKSAAHAAVADTEQAAVQKKAAIDAKMP